MLLRDAPLSFAVSRIVRFALTTASLTAKRLIGRAVPQDQVFRPRLRLRVLAATMSRFPETMREAGLRHAKPGAEQERGLGVRADGHRGFDDLAKEHRAAIGAAHPASFGNAFRFGELRAGFAGHLRHAGIVSH